MVISDEHVWFWHGFRLMSALSRYLGGSTPGDVVVLLLPPGEQAKTRASKEQLEDAMLAARCVDEGFFCRRTPIALCPVRLLCRL